MTHQHQISSKICRSIINPTTRFSNPTCLTPRTEVHFERKAEKKHTAHKEREGMKKRDIKLKYPDAAKADALIDRLHKAGLWHYDPDFDGDKEEGTVLQLYCLLESLLELINYGNQLKFFIPEIKMPNNPMTFRFINYGNQLTFFIPQIKMPNNPMTFGFYPHWFSRRFTTMLAMATRSCRMIQRPSRHPSQPGPKVTSN